MQLLSVKLPREEIATVRRHIGAAAEIAELDPTLAFTGLYDAMRKAIQAHMRAHGYRSQKGRADT